MLDLRRQYPQIRDQVSAAIERVCSTQHFIGGEEVSAFEREAAAFVGAKQGIGCASGTDALWLALQAAGVGPGDAVITTPFSFFASTSTITRTGATPVFADIDPGTLNLDPKAVDRRIASGLSGLKLKAILPVYLYGQCADMDAFARIAAEHKLTVIEDAAQAFGAAWNGRRAGSMGTAAGFSFYPTKNLSAYGDGGLVTTSDETVAERALMLRNHGSRQRYFHDEIGWNSRLDAMQATILRVKLNYIEEWNQARRAKAALYDRLIAESGMAGVVVPLTIRPEAFHVFHQYVVRVPRRDDLRQHLSQHGVGTEIYYPLPLHLQTCFAYLGYKEGDFPEAERAAREVLALPIFPELTESEQRYVIEMLAGFYS